MREPVVPPAGHAELPGARVRRRAGHRVPRLAGRNSSEPRGLRDGRGGAVEALLDPDLGEAGGSPVGEQAHAVAAGHEAGEMIVQGRHRQVLVDPLADVEGRHQVQDQADHHAEGAQVDHGAVEPVAAAAQLHEVAVRGDEGQAGHGRGQVLVGDAGAVGGGGGGAGHRDVRQRGQVAQREAACVQAGGQLGVAQARGHSGHAGGRVDRDLRRQAGQADLGAR